MRARQVLPLILVVAAPASAGQLIVEHFGLADLAAGGSTVYVATVKSAQPHGKRSQALALEVTAVFPSGSATPKVGESTKVTTYGGAEWTDEHRSMRERRLRGAIAPVTAGMRVVVATRGGGLYHIGGADRPPAVVDLLLADDATLRTVAVLFDPQRRAAYANEPVERLRADLANPELAALAVAELHKGGRLTTAALLSAEERFLSAYYRALKPEPRVTFAAEAAALIEKQRALRDRVAELLLDEPLPGMIPALGRLARAYDPKQEAERRTLETLRDALLTLDENAKGRPLDFAPLADFLLVCQVHCAPPPSDETAFRRLTRHLPKAHKTRLAIGLLDNVYTTAAKPDDGPDETLLEEAARLAREAPSPAIIPALAKVDPLRPRITQHREETIGAMMRIAEALMRALPGSAAQARAAIDGWIRQGAAPSDDDRKRWRRLSAK